ncbi:MAG: transposase [Planctomycetota bacterium]|nr:transposase [Planctomycetota bacterium]
MNAAELHRELSAGGCVGSYGSLRRYVAKHLAANGRSRPQLNGIRAPSRRLPSAKQLSFDWVRRPEDHRPEAQSRIDAIHAQSVELATALNPADEFVNLIRGRSTGTLADWLTSGEKSPCRELRSFAEGIRRDEAAVRAVIAERWSNGPVEGHVNRLKTIKRSM